MDAENQSQANQYILNFCIGCQSYHFFLIKTIILHKIGTVKNNSKQKTKLKSRNWSQSYGHILKRCLVWKRVRDHEHAAHDFHKIVSLFKATKSCR